MKDNGPTFYGNAPSITGSPDIIQRRELAWAGSSDTEAQFPGADHVLRNLGARHLNASIFAQNFLFNHDQVLFTMCLEIVRRHYPAYLLDCLVLISSAPDFAARLS